MKYYFSELSYSKGVPMKAQPMGIKRNFYASHSWKGKGLRK